MAKENIVRKPAQPDKFNTEFLYKDRGKYNYEKLLVTNLIAYLKHIQTVAIAEVPAANLGTHVPAVEGIGREFDPSTVEPHARYRWQGVPT